MNMSKAMRLLTPYRISLIEGSRCGIGKAGLWLQRVIA
jgi:hypothetical protein